MVVISVNGKPLPYLVDSGATRSTICEDHFKGKWEPAEPSFGINGILTKTYRTPPLPIEDDEGYTICTHSFRIIPRCPVNLLGRDLFGPLGITIRTNSEGGLDISSDKITIIACKPSLLMLSQQSSEEDFEDIDPQVWSTSDLDVGHISCTPYKATLKEGAFPIYHKQYPLSKEMMDGIVPMVKKFL